MFGGMKTCSDPQKTVSDGSENCDIFSAMSAVLMDSTAGVKSDTTATGTEWTRTINRSLRNIRFGNLSIYEVPMTVCNAILSSMLKQTGTCNSAKWKRSRIVPHVLMWPLYAD